MTNETSKKEVDFISKVLFCVDCGASFTFTAGEQEYYFSQGLAVPRRCKRCRFIRKVKDSNRYD